jgi:type VI secretion system protein VasG
LAESSGALASLQGETPLVRVCADAQMVGEVISAWTGIPAGKMMRDEVQSVLVLGDQLKRRIIGQDHALAAISQRIRTSRANLEDRTSRWQSFFSWVRAASEKLKRRSRSRICFMAASVM